MNAQAQVGLDHLPELRVLIPDEIPQLNQKHHPITAPEIYERPSAEQKGFADQYRVVLNGETYALEKIATVQSKISGANTMSMQIDDGREHILHGFIRETKSPPVLEILGSDRVLPLTNAGIEHEIDQLVETLKLQHADDATIIRQVQLKRCDLLRARDAYQEGVRPTLSEIGEKRVKQC